MVRDGACAPPHHEGLRLLREESPHPEEPAAGGRLRTMRSHRLEKDGRVEVKIPSELYRYPHRRAQAAHRAVAEHDVAAMRAGDVAGDRKPEACATLVLISRVVEPQEWLEHLLAHVSRNAGAIIVD